MSLVRLSAHVQQANEQELSRPDRQHELQRDRGWRPHGRNHGDNAEEAPTASSVVASALPQYHAKVLESLATYLMSRLPEPRLANGTAMAATATTLMKAP